MSSPESSIGGAIPAAMGMTSSAPAPPPVPVLPGVPSPPPPLVLVTGAAVPTSGAVAVCGSGGVSTRVGASGAGAMLLRRLAVLDAGCVAAAPRGQRRRVTHEPKDRGAG